MAAAPWLSWRRLLYTVLLFAVAAVVVYPVFLTVVTSLKPDDEVISSPLALPKNLTFSAYPTAWEALGFGHLLMNSLLYAAAGAGLALLLAILPAYAFSRFRFVGGRAVFILLLTTLALPQQPVLIPLYRLLTDLGMLNTQVGLIVIHAAFGLPLQMLLLTGFMSSLPRELEEASRMDGCTDWGVLRHVVIPLSLPAMAVGFLLNFVGIWKEFIFALTFLNSESVFPITTGILKFTSTQYFTSFTQPAAAVVLSLLPMVVVFILAHRWLTQGIYTGALKG